MDVWDRRQHFSTLVSIHGCRQRFEADDRVCFASMPKALHSLAQSGSNGDNVTPLNILKTGIAGRIDPFVLQFVTPMEFSKTLNDFIE